MVWKEALDLEYWLINTLSGNEIIFVLISFIFIVALAAYFRMNNILTGIMLILFGVMVVSYTSVAGLYVLMLVIISLLVFNVLGRIVKK